MHKFLTGVFLVGMTVSPSWAGVLTNLSFTSNGESFVNNTIVDGTTSPLAFTLTTNLAQPFLNAADSTVSLNYGSYYAISFLEFGAHVGSGTVSFLLDGTSMFSLEVTFPDPALPSGNFATFALPGGDLVTVSATGLAADRIRIAADGGGLASDEFEDAFYQFNYTAGSSAVPEPATAVLFGFGAAILVLRRWKR